MRDNVLLGLIVALCVPAVLGAAPVVPTDSPVADAAQRGDTGAVRALLKQGTDVNVPQSDGMTALHWAATRGVADLAEMLIYAGAHVDAGTRIGSYTPLHLASEAANVAVVATLLGAGADANARTTAGGASPLHLAAATGSVETIELLLEAGAEVDGTDFAWEQTPLMFAAVGNRVEAVTALLKGGAAVAFVGKVVDVVARAEADREAGRLRNRQRAALRALEEEDEAEEDDEAEEGEEGEEGEDAGEGDESAEGEEAAEGDNPGEVEEDPEGQEPTAPAEDEQEAEGEEATEPAEDEQEAEGEEATAAVKDERAPEGEEAAEPAEEEEGVAAEEAGEPAKDEEAVEGEESEEGGEADKKDEPKEDERPPTYAELVGGHGGLTALLYAAREGHVETVTVLLDAGTDINQVSGGDQTSPMLIATLNGHFDLAMMMLARGADPNLASAAGATPLYGALNVRWAPRSAYPQQNAYKQQHADYLELITALLDAGADPDVRLTKHLWYTSFNFDHLLNSAGATPFWRAAYATDVDAMRLLVRYGADPNIPTRKLPSRGRPRPQGEDGKDEEKEDPSGLPEVPIGGPAVSPIHAASGAGYGEGFPGYAHQHVPDGWMPAVRYLIDELGVDINERDHRAYNLVHHAAARGDFEMILYLVLRGADVTEVSRKGQTTVDMANGPVQRIQPFPRAVWLLERLGAKNNDNCVSC